MICSRCLFRATTRSHATGTRQRLLPSTTTPIISQTTTATAPTPPTPHRLASTSTTTSPRKPPAATSTSAAQPFSTPLTPSPTAAGVEPGKHKSAAPALVLSSVPAGTPLKGLNFEKAKSDPVALEDAEYPAWLWGVLDSGKGKGGKGAVEGGEGEGEGEGDLFSQCADCNFPLQAKSKKQRRIAAKKLRKQALLHPESLAPKVPLYEQSVDLPAGDGTVEGAVQAARAREELTRAMRKKRRSAIKEDNFLRAMG